MYKSLRTSLAFVSYLAVLLTSLSASQHGYAKKGEDHPLINRFPNTKIRYYEQLGYEEMQFPLSKPYKQDGKFIADKLLPLEGKVTYIHYEVPSKYSALQVFRNYQKAIKKQGMEVLFNCERTCVNTNAGNLDKLFKNHQDFYLNGVFYQYIVAKKGNNYLALIVNDDIGVFQLVVEQESIDDDMISPIAQSIGETGKVDLYGIFFDTGKSDIKPESREEMDELAVVLEDFPELKIKIVGHTDSVGDNQKNLKLSQSRAKAVYDQLVNDYGIERSRLTAIGKGESEPLASNSSKDGRAQNRRVEVVAVNPHVVSGGAPSDYSAEVEAEVAQNDASNKTENEEQESSYKDAIADAKDKVDDAEKVKNMANKLKKFF